MKKVYYKEKKLSKFMGSDEDHTTIANIASAAAAASAADIHQTHQMSEFMC